MTNERIHQHEQTGGTGPDPFSDGFSSGTAVADAQIQVIHGVHAHQLPLVGRTVGQARAELSERMNIAPDAVAVVNGNTMSEDTVLLEGQVLTFVKHSGEKGSGPQKAGNAASFTEASDGSNLPASVSVFCGVRGMEVAHAAGMTVQSLRNDLVEVLDIPPDALPIVDGKLADGDTSVGPGQVVGFTMHAGVMGGERIWEETTTT